MGCRLGASHVIGLSAQFDLSRVLDTPEDIAANPVLAAYLDVGRYVDLSELIRTTEVPIYFLYAAGDPMDQAQLGAISGLESVRAIGFRSRVHGSTCWSSSLPTLIGLGSDGLDELAERFSGAIVSPWRFSAALDGWRTTAGRLVRRWRTATGARSATVDPITPAGPATS